MSSMRFYDRSVTGYKKHEEIILIKFGFTFTSQVAGGPQEILFLNILQHLLSIEPKNSDTIWTTAETLGETFMRLNRKWNKFVYRLKFIEQHWLRIMMILQNFCDLRTFKRKHVPTVPLTGSCRYHIISQLRLSNQLPSRFPRRCLQYPLHLQVLKSFVDFFFYNFDSNISNLAAIPPPPPMRAPPAPPACPPAPELPKPAVETNTLKAPSKATSETLSTLPQQALPFFPRAKMKTINWNKIPPSKVVGKNNIWSIVADNHQNCPMDEMNWDEMEGLFCQQQGSPKLGRDSAGGEAVDTNRRTRKENEVSEL